MTQQHAPNADADTNADTSDCNANTDTGMKSLAAGVGIVPRQDERVDAVATIQRLEEQLHQSEARYQALLTAVNQITWTTRADGWVDDIPHWRAYTGQTVDEVRGFGWMEALHPDDREHTARIWEEARSLGNPCEIEYRARRFDGLYRSFLVRAVPVRDSNGDIREWTGFCTDITDRKQAEEERAKTLALLQTVLEVLPAGVSIADAQGRMLHVNAAYREIWGLMAPLLDNITKYDEYKGWWRRSGKRIAPEQWAMARALLHGEVVQSDEIDIAAFDGRRKSIMNNAAPIRDESGAIVGGVVALLDISEHTSFENERARLLAEAETERARWRAAMDNTPELVATCDAEMTRTYINPAYARMLEHPVDFAAPPESWAARFGFLQLNGSGLFPFEQLPFRRALQENQPVHGIEILHRAPSGVERLVSWDSAPMRTPEGELLGAVAIGRDITAHRRLERQNRAALNVLLRITQIVTEPRLHADPAHLLPRVAEALIDLEAADFAHTLLVERGTGRLIPLAIYDKGGATNDADVWKDAVRSADAPTGPRVQGMYAQLRTGQILVQRFERGDSVVTPQLVQALHLHAAITAPVLVGGELVGLLTLSRSRPAEADNGDFFAPWDEELMLGVGRMAGEALAQARLRSQLTASEAAQLAAEETAHQRDEFLGIASHELKTPLTSVKANLQLAVRRVQRLADTVAPLDDTTGTLARQIASLHAMLALALSSAERQGRLVNDLLDVSRIQEGKLEFRRAPCDLAALVHESVEEQQLGNPTREITLAVPDKPVMIAADHDRILQVCANYLTNALKYSKADQPVTLTLRVEAGAARLNVCDGGPGLPREEQGRIWERFYRVEGIEHRHGSGIGLGLGLYISKTIIERHGGGVGVESAPGEGSTFWFTLPLLADQQS